jgi:hypothetical protein
MLSLEWSLPISVTRIFLAMVRISFPGNQPSSHNENRPVGGALFAPLSPKRFTLSLHERSALALAFTLSLAAPKFI